MKEESAVNASRQGEINKHFRMALCVICWRMLDGEGDSGSTSNLRHFCSIRKCLSQDNGQSLEFRNF
jgi:hypothetical protein